MLTQSRLRELLHYDPETGRFTWISRPSNRVKIGSEAGRIDAGGYRGIRVDGVLYYAHRLAHLYMRGYWPAADVDHDNRVRSDNRWSNLIAATRSENLQNQGLAPNNKSGYRGVSFHKAAGKWAAERWINGQKHYLGLFPTAEAARDAWVEFSVGKGVKI